MRASIVFSALLLVCTLASGCGASDPRTAGFVPVSGTVTLAGAPLEDAIIVFHRADDPARHGSGAQSMVGGKFTLSTYRGGDGVLPGEYIVTVSKVTMEYPISNEEMRRLEDADQPTPPGKEVYHIPVKYGDKETTDLRVTVPPKGSTSLVLELQDGDKTPPK